MSRNSDTDEGPPRPPRRYVAPCPSCSSTRRHRANVDGFRVVTCAECSTQLHRFPLPDPPLTTGPDARPPA